MKTGKPVEVRLEVAAVHRPESHREDASQEDLGHTPMVVPTHRARAEELQRAIATSAL